MSQKQIELTPEQYEELISSLEEFEEKSLEHLAETKSFELIPTTLENGRPLKKENFVAIKRECSKLGLKLLYKIDINPEHYVIINPETLKTIYYSESVH